MDNLNISNKDIYTAIWYAKSGKREKAVAFLRTLLPAPKSKTSTTGVRRIAIIVGHNKVAKGAYCGGSIDQYEYEFNSIVADLMKDIADNDNRIEIKIFFRKYLGRKQYIAEIVDVYKRVNAWKPEVSMELHFNSLGGVGRIEMIYYKDSIKSKRLATHTLRNTIEVMDHKGSTKLLARAKSDRGGQSLYRCNSPIVMTEPFDAGNTKHVRKIGEIKHIGIAKANIKSIIQYLNLN